MKPDDHEERFMVDLGELTQAVVPYLSAVAGAYGNAVVQRVRNEATEAAADTTVGLGQRLLRRLLASRRSEQIEDAMTDVAGNPEDEATTGVLQAQIRRALAEDPDLAEEIARLLASATTSSDRFTVNVTHSQGFQFGSHNTQTNTFPGPPTT
jgi:hypothetical protein